MDAASEPTRVQDAFMRAKIDPAHGDVAMIICFYITCLIDAGMFSSWSVFTGMQTGNTVFVGIGTARLPTDNPNLWLRALLAVVGFLLGAFSCSRLARWAGPLRRSTLCASFFVQAVLIMVPAILVQVGAVPARFRRDNELICIVIPMLSLQFGAQVTTSRFLGFNELPTTVLTSLYNDLASDADLFAWRNIKRNRRVLAALAAFVGAVCGAFMERRAGLASILWLAMTLKFSISASWLAFPRALVKA